AHILPRQYHPSRRAGTGVLVFDGLFERADARQGECENRAGGIDRFQVARPEPLIGAGSNTRFRSCGNIAQWFSSTIREMATTTNDIVQLILRQLGSGEKRLLSLVVCVRKGLSLSHPLRGDLTEMVRSAL